jgi:hypothetical protein
MVLALALAAWGWFDVRKRGSVEPGNIHMTDFTVYTEAGAAFFDGRDPYSVTNPRGWGYLYPPLFAMLVAPLDRLQPTTQVLIWFALSTLLCWECYRLALRVLRVLLPAGTAAGSFGPLPDWIGYLAVATVTLPALNCLQRGQVSVIKVYLLMLGFRMWVETRSARGRFFAGNLLALPIVLKITPLIPVCVLLLEPILAAWRRPPRRGAMLAAASGSAGTWCGLMLGLLVVPAMLVGWNANWQHLNHWYSWAAQAGDRKIDDRFEGDSTSVRNQSLVNAARLAGNWAHYRLAGGPHDLGPEQYRKGGRGLLMESAAADTALLAARLAAACLLLAATWRVGRTGAPLAQASVFGLACAATLILSPIARVHYYCMLWPAALLVPAWLWSEGRSRWAIAMAVVPALLVIVFYCSMKVTGRVGLLGLGITFWYATACSLLVLRPAREQLGAWRPETIAWPSFDAHGSHEQPRARAA